jgi:hypothetical protein
MLWDALNFPDICSWPTARKAKFTGFHRPMKNGVYSIPTAVCSTEEGKEGTGLAAL